MPSAFILCHSPADFPKCANMFRWWSARAVARINAGKRDDLIDRVAGGDAMNAGIVSAYRDSPRTIDDKTHMSRIVTTIVDDRLSRAVYAACYGIAATLLSGCVPATHPVPVRSPHTPAVFAAPPARLQVDDHPQLASRISMLGSKFNGAVGISVRDVSSGWTTGFAASQPRPQQSVSKLWVALTILDAVDHGRLSLQDPVLILPGDLTLFHQPIRDLVGADGYRTTIGDLLRQALTHSDNTANDALLRAAGGPTAVRACLTAKGVTGIAFGPGERLLQSATAGLAWKQEYSAGEAFFVARAALPMATRSAALARYLASPPDGASAEGIAAALGRLAGGQLLSPTSTSLLITLMTESVTGPQRIRGGLAPGWTFAHKTGTGQELDGLATGYNDVGLLTSPSGHRYAVAVMIASTREPIPVRQALMSDVARAVIAAEPD